VNGCGSSREHAPWRCSSTAHGVIRPSYGDIFNNRCEQLPAGGADQSQVTSCFTTARRPAWWWIPTGTYRRGRREIAFDVQPFRKYCLVNGFDDIGLTLRHADKIRAFEDRRRQQLPWLFR
jgi:3-isopropylmalate/(R)-2-methylmalate dehydratase small subunit